MNDRSMTIARYTAVLVMPTLLPAGGMAADGKIKERHIAEDDLTRYVHQYMISQFPDREIEDVHVLSQNGERVGYKVEYTPDSGKTLYFHPDGRPMDAPPTK